PLVTAGALANLDYLLDNDLQTNARKVGEHLFSRLHDLEHRHDFIGDVRGKGLMIGIELVTPPGKEPNTAAAGRIMEESRQRGLLIGKGGLYNNCVRMAPPLSITMEEADEGFDLFADAVAAAEDKL
ncbi:MAG TPA: aminotransferase class III-fold pyridoxal phosphate-dependent enzyme, partial [Actinomycetota bacterium]|nr:aminotransferase class III-fold pyridoxal phosphate-dependent enzyme [Actinomycetota bacterium]